MSILEVDFRGEKMDWSNRYNLCGGAVSGTPRRFNSEGVIRGGFCGSRI